MKDLQAILTLIQNQQTPEEIETCGIAVKEFLMHATYQERQTVQTAVWQHLDDFMAETQEMITKAEKYLVIDEQKMDLGEWLTINEYAKRFGLKSTNVVSNRIKRGLIPQDHVFVVKELNNLKLIRA